MSSSNVRKNNTSGIYKFACNRHIGKRTKSIGVSDGRVGLQTISTFTSKYVLPGWWCRLFVGSSGGLVDFLSNENVVGVSYVNSGVRFSYPDLVERLERYGYSYRLPRRWRKKVPRDWRRRSGVIIVDVASGVDCLVKLSRGYVERIQIVGSVKGFEDLGVVGEFLNRVFSVRVGVKEFVSIPSISRPDPNKLKSLSWNVVRRAKDSWIPVTGFGRWLSDKIVKRLEKDMWIEVVSAPRVGKSSGILLGLMKWIIERGIDNYVVLVVVVNRRIGRQLYKYLLGAWKRVLKDLRELGWNAGMLAEKVRIRYYEGMESACLVNRRIHKFEDCLKCPLFQLYSSEWRRVYRFPVPVTDPVILKLSGYCPFQVLFSSSFWRNSFVLVHYRMLPLVVSILSRMGVRRIIVYFGEYLVHLSHRVGLKRLNPGRIDERILCLEVEYNGRRIRFKDVVYMYNRMIDEFVWEIFRFFDDLGYEIYEGADEKSREFPGILFLDYVRMVVRGDVDLSSIEDRIRRRIVELVDILERFHEKYRLAIFSRFLRYIVYVFYSFFRVEFDGEKYVRRFFPEVSDTGISGTVGGFVYGFMEGLKVLERNQGKEIYVVSSSVDDSNFSFENDISSHLRLRIISPYEDLRYHRLSIVYSRGVVEYPTSPFMKDPSYSWNYVRSLKELFELLRNGKRNVGVVLDKESMLLLGKEFEKLGWKIEYGKDSENPNIVDYVVVHRPNNSIILLFHPHGRTSMGVDPPYRDRIESVIVALGLRGYPRYVVTVPSVFRVIGREFDGKSVGTDDLPGVYSVIKSGFLYVYDVFSLKYDLHLMVQIIGRFFLSRSMKFVLLNPRYGIRDIKFFVLVHYLDSDKYGNLVGRVYRVSYVDKYGREYNEFQLRMAGMRWLDVKMKLYEINIDRFTRSNSNGYVVNLRNVRYIMYNMLRCVYNSLRYVRKQLKHNNQPDRWWFVKKFVYLINGFEYARLNNMSVPSGLKKCFRIYCNEGLLSLLEYVYNKYLQGVDPKVWKFIMLYIYRVVRGWLGIKLDENYIKSFIGVDKREIFDQKSLDKYLVMASG